MKVILFFVLLWTLTEAVLDQICIRGFVHKRSILPVPHAANIHFTAINAKYNGLYYTYHTKKEDNTTTEAVNFRNLNRPQDEQSKDLFYSEKPVGLTIDAFTGGLYLLEKDKSSETLNLYTYFGSAGVSALLAKNITVQSLHQFSSFKDSITWIDGGDYSMYFYNFQSDSPKTIKVKAKVLAYTQDRENSGYIIRPDDNLHVFKVKKGQKPVVYESSDYVDALKIDTNGNVVIGSSRTSKLYELHEERNKIVQISDWLPHHLEDIAFDQKNSIVWVERKEESVSTDVLQVVVRYAKTETTCDYLYENKITESESSTKKII